MAGGQRRVISRFHVEEVSTFPDMTVFSVSGTVAALAEVAAWLRANHCGNPTAAAYNAFAVHRFRRVMFATPDQEKLVILFKMRWMG